MLIGLFLVAVGVMMNLFAWGFYRRDYPTFWVSKPVWYFLYPKGVALTIGGVWILLAGAALYLKS